MTSLAFVSLAPEKVFVGSSVFAVFGADACVFRLMEEQRMVMTIVIHVDDNILLEKGNVETSLDGVYVRDASGTQNIGQLRRYSGCCYERGI